MVRVRFMARNQFFLKDFLNYYNRFCDNVLFIAMFILIVHGNNKSEYYRQPKLYFTLKTIFDYIHTQLGLNFLNID